MATLMQKDALIERVASVLAMIARKIPRSEGRTPDQSRLVALPGNCMLQNLKISILTK